MKLTLLQIKEDILMQLLWQNKKATAEVLKMQYPLKRSPSIKAIKEILGNLERAHFIRSEERQGQVYYFPLSKRKKDIRFRAHYRVVGYFHGSFKQLEHFLHTVTVEEIPLFDSLRDNIGEVIRLSIIRAYYWFKYPKADYRLVEVSNASAASFKKKIIHEGKEIILAYGNYIKPKRFVFVLVGRESLKLYDFKKQTVRKILADKSFMLHRQFYRNSLKTDAQQKLIVS